MFAKAVAIEQKVMKNAGAEGDKSFAEFGMQGRQYTWSGGETLLELVARQDEIMARHEETLLREKKRAINKPLWEIFSEALDDEDGAEQCAVCSI